MMKHVARTLTIAALLACGMTPTAKAEDRREIAFPDWGEYRTLKCDFHMHTVFSDGLVWPTVRVDEAWREGLDAIAITDHIEYRPHREEVKGDFNRSYEIARDAARQRNILVIPGVEITRDTPPGHFNALFLSDSNALDVKDFYEAFEQAGRPFTRRMPGWARSTSVRQAWVSLIRSRAGLWKKSRSRS